MKHLIFSLAVSLLLTLSSCSAPYSFPQEDRIATAITHARLRKPSEGPQLICRPLNEQEKEKSPEINPHMSILEATGLCQGDEYALYVTRLDGCVMCQGNYRVSDELQLVSIEDGQLLSASLMVLDGFMKGEEISFTLVCKNKDHAAAVVVSPNPIEAKWSDGAYVSVSAIAPSMEMFLLVGTGFVPGEPLRKISRSWNEVLDNETTVNSDGSMFMILAPMVKGKSGGVNRLSIDRLVTGEKRTLVIPYGSVAKIQGKQ